jgi:6-phosphogluconolactonase (cycloisomerase 2 family)
MGCLCFHSSFEGKLMSLFCKNCFGHLFVALLAVCLGSACAFGASGNPILIANDDSVGPLPGTVTIYTIGTDGALTFLQQVKTGGLGIAGGFFGTNRVAVLNGPPQSCIYVSDAATADVAGIDATTLKPGGRAQGSSTDTGAGNGIGLAMNAQYLYASFTDTSTIGTFQVTSGCGLQFIGDTVVGGMQNGTLDAMAVHGNTLVVTYGDGSIESFDISAGTPASHGDKQNSTGFDGATYPNGIDITQDGRFAIFGDTATSTILEVSDLSSGKLAPTVVYNMGRAISSSNLLLSPDESVLYIANTQGDSVSAMFFDKTTGRISRGCTSGTLKDYVSGWSYLAGIALQQTTGNGAGVYVAEYGAPSSIAVVNLSVSGRSCTLTEAPISPVADPHSPGLLSIGTFPARSF